MTEKGRALGSDLEAVDAHILGPEDYADIPELGDEWFERAVPHNAGVPLRRGRPKAAATKQQVTLRLDREVLERFRQSGDGWQSRINEALRKAAGF